MLLHGKRAVVTGGASGIGAAVVRAYAAAGAAVVSLDMDDQRGVLVASEAAGLGPGSVHFRCCDVSSNQEVQSCIGWASEVLGGLDVLAHVAGIIDDAKPAEEWTETDFQRMIDVHLKGTVFTNQAAFRAMRTGGGAIINFASRAGVEGVPGNATYAAAKGAVLAWTRTVAREWGRLNIRVNAVCPSIWTPMFDRVRERLTPDERSAVDRNLAQSIPLGGKLGDADRDMAPVMLFLGSDMSRFITGQTLPVDGGYLILT